MTVTIMSLIYNAWDSFTSQSHPRVRDRSRQYASLQLDPRGTARVSLVSGGRAAYVEFDDQVEGMITERLLHNSTWNLQQTYYQEEGRMGPLRCNAQPSAQSAGPRADLEPWLSDLGCCRVYPSRYRYPSMRVALQSWTRRRL